MVLAREMYANREKKAVYLANPHTASLATGKTLVDKLGFEKINQAHHEGLWAEGSPVTPENRHEWFVFTTVRNHWDAAASWLMRGQATRDKKEWGVEDYKTALDNKWIAEHTMWHLHWRDADYFMRYEDLDNAFDRALAKCDLPQTYIEPYNVSKWRHGEPYERFFTSETRDYIGDRFSSEIALLGYVY